MLVTSSPFSPGSALLDDHDTGAVPDAIVSHLKKGTGRFSHIVLQPQPSDDPRDPLNWPRWKKEGVFWTLTYMAGLVGELEDGWTVVCHRRRS